MMSKYGPASASPLAPRPFEQMIAELEDATGVDVASSRNDYELRIATLRSEVQATAVHDALMDLQSALHEQKVVDNIRAVQSWATGEDTFRITTKSWRSMIDKLYRLNVEQNRQYPHPPIVPTTRHRAHGAEAGEQRWITPDNVFEVADDLLRTKYVVPFADGVVDVSAKIEQIANRASVMRFQRIHAKDSGYHARHHYLLLPTPVVSASHPYISLEIKVLTKMQDTLGELTHLLYESRRTGGIEAREKSAVAWDFESPEFRASYVGHAAHLIEVMLVDIKNQIGGEQVSGQS